MACGPPESLRPPGRLGRGNRPARRYRNRNFSGFGQPTWLWTLST